MKVENSEEYKVQPSTRDVPAKNHARLRRFIPGWLQPYLRGVRRKYIVRERPADEPFRTVFPYSQVHPLRQRHLVRLAQDIEAKGIPGAIVECGVLDGGTAALMAWASSGSGRAVHLFDSWQGMPSSTAKDGVGSEEWEGETVGSISRVRNVIRRLGVATDRITFHKGWFSETFPKASAIDAIALIHVDADFYESVKLSIETWYPKLCPGGYMQFDDYTSFVGCRLAVDEFLTQHRDLRLEDHEGVVFFIQRPLTS